MLKKDCIAVEFGGTSIRMLDGNKGVIKSFLEVKMDEADFSNDKIFNIDAVYAQINMFIRKNNVKSKNISFSLRGQDIVIRNMEVPIIDEKSIREAVNNEIMQFLPENGANHYIDYEIIEKIMTHEKKVYKLLVAAAPKAKIDSCVELAEKLKLKLSAVDVSANCLTRLFREINKGIYSEKSIAVIELGVKSSRLMIVEKGSLYTEREVPYGIYNMENEIMKKIDMDRFAANDYIFNKLDMSSSSKNEVYEEIRVKLKSSLDSVMSSFSKVIKFYTSSNAAAKIDEIYVMGTGANVRGIVEYINKSLNVSALMLDNSRMAKMKVKIPLRFDFTKYSVTYGLLLRKE